LQNNQNISARYKENIVKIAYGEKEVGRTIAAKKEELQ